jgi:hypothetical protein
MKIDSDNRKRINKFFKTIYEYEVIEVIYQENLLRE